MESTQHAQTTDAATLFAPLLALMDRFDAHLAEFAQAAMEAEAR